jgi:hypothetical protein
VTVLLLPIVCTGLAAVILVSSFFSTLDILGSFSSLSNTGIGLEINCISDLLSEIK